MTPPGITSNSAPQVRSVRGDENGCEIHSCVKEFPELLHNLVMKYANTGGRGPRRHPNHTPPFRPENCPGV